MPADTTKIRVISSAGPDDATGVIYLGRDAQGQTRQVVVGGDPIDATPEEMRMIHSTGAQVEEVSADGSGDAERAAKYLDAVIDRMPKEIVLETEQPKAPEQPSSTVRTEAAPGAPTATAGSVPVQPPSPSSPPLPVNPATAPSQG